MGTKVSMIVPCYNKEDYIAEMLQSVYAQIWDDIELIFVYDKSSDHTKDIIIQWLPLLKKRGYETHLLEREKPMGLPAAVRDGMLTMTGDYFCTVDCDDMLHPEYVSIMAGWLEENKDYEWAGCDFKKYMTKSKKNPKDISSDYIDIVEPPALIEKFLLGRIPTTIWRYLIRVSYVRKCKIIDNFVVEPRVCQEPQIFIPLAAHEGKIKYFNEVLYYYRVATGGPHFLLQIGNNMDYADQYVLLCKQVMEKLDVCEKKRDKWLAILSIAAIKMGFYLSSNYYYNKDNIAGEADKAVSLINQRFRPYPPVTVETFLTTGYRVFFQAVENSLFRYRNRYIDAPLLDARYHRVIAFGAKGWLGSELLPALFASPWTPTVLWDNAANPGEVINGVPVEIPAFEILGQEDLLLVIPRNIVPQQYVKEQVENHRCGCKCLYHFDILELLAAYFYPQLQLSPQNITDNQGE